MQCIFYADSETRPSPMTLVNTLPGGVMSKKLFSSRARPLVRFRVKVRVRIRVRPYNE